MRHSSQSCGIVCFSLGESGFSCSFTSSRPLLSSWILFCKAPLSCLEFPVVVSDTPSVYNQATAKLAVHGSCRNNGYLATAVRERQYILLNQIILLFLIGNDLVK